MERPISHIAGSGKLRMAAVTNKRDTNCQALASYVINTIAGVTSEQRSYTYIGAWRKARPAGYSGSETDVVAHLVVTPSEPQRNRRRGDPTPRSRRDLDDAGPAEANRCRARNSDGLRGRRAERNQLAARAVGLSHGSTTSPSCPRAEENPAPGADSSTCHTGTARAGPHGSVESTICR
jgi:hypothetical protein